MSINLYELTKEMLDLQRMIEEGEEGSDLGLADTVEMVCEDFVRKAEDYAKLIRCLEVDRDKLKTESDRLAKRSKSIGNKIDHLKQSLLSAMQATQTDRIKGDILTISLRDNPGSVLVTNIEALPDEYKDTTIIVNANKKDLAKVLKAGEQVPGCELVKSQSLNIR